MNKGQRSQLARWAKTLEELTDVDRLKGMDKAWRELRVAEVSQIKDAIEEMRDGEQEKFDNMPEGLRSGSQGEAIQEASEWLDAAIANLDEAVNYEVTDGGWPDDFSDDLANAIESMNTV